MIISSSLSISTESENPFFSLSVSSCCGDQTTCDLISDTSSSSLATSVSLNESFEAKSGLNDISTSCIDPPVQPKLATYPLNHRKCSFQSSWYIDRQWLENSIQKDACYCYYSQNTRSCFRILPKPIGTSTRSL
ncbi:unnamed protein product [Rotaria socialis]|uniref:Uncharacterized protein n=1 Tax=Rotaria socialis TaxID=392032 RepID=A0A818A1Y0_9BILA|nr:unnamed protein product [Rotaria socialis]